MTKANCDKGLGTGNRRVEESAVVTQTQRKPDENASLIKGSLCVILAWESPLPLWSIGHWATGTKRAEVASRTLSSLKKTFST